jgi:hypothetical protein
MNGTYREAFDLRNRACRKNFIKAIRKKWLDCRWWRMVVSDTRRRVCSKNK